MFSTTSADQYPVTVAAGLPAEQAPTPHPIRKWLVILVFCVFAGLIAETFVTSSSSPQHILLQPFIVPFNIVLYGAFDLLASLELRPVLGGVASE